MKPDDALDAAFREHEKKIDSLIAEAYNAGFEDGQEYAQEPPERNPESDE